MLELGGGLVTLLGQVQKLGLGLGQVLELGVGLVALSGWVQKLGLGLGHGHLLEAGLWFGLG